MTEPTKRSKKLKGAATLSPAQMRVCLGLGISPERYLARMHEQQAAQQEPTPEQRIEALSLIRGAPGLTASERALFDEKIKEIERED